jgi:hypothetical protein
MSEDEITKWKNKYYTSLDNIEALERECASLKNDLTHAAVIQTVPDSSAETNTRPDSSKLAQILAAAASEEGNQSTSPAKPAQAAPNTQIHT